MPTYEYRCPKGHEFELFQSMSEEPRTLCPECGELAQRLISGGAGLIFKGDGFYITDYRSDEYKKAASSDKEAVVSEKGTSGDASGDASAGDSSGKSDGGQSDDGKSSSGKSGSEEASGGSDKASSSSKGSSSHASGSSGGSKRSGSDKSSSSDS